MVLSNKETENLKEGFQAFGVENATPYGNGHIHGTFLSTDKKIIIQKLNILVFPNLTLVMQNVEAVTEYLKKIISSEGGNIHKETLNIVYPIKPDAIKTTTPKSVYKASDGSYYRAYEYIDNTLSYDAATSADLFGQSAELFGSFARRLDNYPAHTLNETIKDFHNTPIRFENFLKAVEQDSENRAKLVQEQIDFVLSKKDDCSFVTEKVEHGKIPLRVSHNDTKLNNILFDCRTKKGICVIDLDTVMPGLWINDFGDAIRFGASTAAEDEKDLSKVECSLEYFEAFTRGYLSKVQDALTDAEKDLLPWGAKLMTLECGIRFLTDYLQGDSYFKTAYSDHNLDRANTQFKLVSDMENKWDKLENIVKNS